MFVLGGLRTPFCKYIGSSKGGIFKNLSISDLSILTAKILIKNLGIEKANIEEIILGNVFQCATDAIYEARNIGLKLNLPMETTALNVNRNCASGMQAIVNAVMEILVQKLDLVLVCGAENMSQIPHIVRGLREGGSFKNFVLEDFLFESLKHKCANTSMPETAENIAKKYNISRQEMDEYAFLSHKRTFRAFEKGIFNDEIIEVDVKIKSQNLKINRDDSVRYDISIEQLNLLPSAFKSDGMVTAGNACSITDGAVSVLMASENYVKKNNLKPLGKIINWQITGLEPDLMGLGPISAVKKLLQKNDLKISDIDLFEINEAFASQYLAVEKELNLNRDKVNVNGGAIAIGHPLGASGARIVLTLLNELKRRGGKYGIASMCVGGGQGMAILVESS